MKRFVALLFIAVSIAGCVYEGPAISKSAFGNLQVNVYGPKDVSVRGADIYVDDAFIGNATPEKPVLYIKRGERRIRVELPGYVPYCRSVHVLGDPNHQVLNVYLKPVGGGPPEGK